MRNERPPFVRLLLGNLRLSALVCMAVAAGLAIYALIVAGEFMWNILVFLAIGMLISSLANAWADARRGRKPAP